MFPIGLGFVYCINGRLGLLVLCDILTISELFGVFSSFPLPGWAWCWEIREIHQAQSLLVRGYTLVACSSHVDKQLLRSLLRLKTEGGAVAQMEMFSWCQELSKGLREKES
jgi:hypothetical protein